MAFSARPNVTKRCWPMELGGFMADDGETIYNYGLDGETVFKRRFGKSTIWEPAPEFDMDAAITTAVNELLTQMRIVSIEQLVELELMYGRPSH